MIIMIFAVVLLVLGLVRKQPRKYWIAAFIAVLFQAVMNVLFHMDTGLLAPTMKQLVGDGPAEGVYAIVVIVVAWGVPVFLVSRSYQRQPKAPPSS